MNIIPLKNRRYPGIFILLALVGCGAPRGNPEDKIGTVGGGVHAVSVETAVAGMKNLVIEKTYSGPLEGEQQANIVAKISERVLSLKVRVGQEVHRGKVIVSLDKSGTASQYFQAEANYRNAGKTLGRMKSLYGEGAIALQSLDGAQTAYDVARANFDAARGVVDLTTPIDGVVTAINVSVGDLASPGVLLATIAHIERMKVIFNMNETDIASIGLDQKVSVHSEARADVAREGRIVQLSKSADVRSRSFEIKALFPNTQDRWFKPGMFGKVTLEVSPHQESLVVPNGAIESDGTTSRVFIVRSGRAFLRPVNAGVTDGAYTVVASGLSVGDTVVTVGANNLKDSSAVAVVNR